MGLPGTTVVGISKMTRRIKKKLLFGKSDEYLLRLRDYKMLISRMLGVIERSKLRGLLHLRAGHPDQLYR